MWGFASGAILLAGCREREVQPAYNRNLGTAEAPLLPPPSVVLDTDILHGPRVRPLELPDFNKDLPTLAEIEAQAASRSDESAREEGPDDRSAGAVGDHEDEESGADDEDYDQEDNEGEDGEDDEGER